MEEGVAYLARHASVEVATAWQAEVRRTVELLTRHPLMGRARADLRPAGLRSIVLQRFPRYLLFHRVHADTLEILRVKHGMMNLPGLFGRE